MFTVTFTESAFEDLRSFPKVDQARLVDAAQRYLAAHPSVASRRCKELRPNDLSRWELRVGDHRIFYDVDETSENVSVKSVGIKRHNVLFVRGKEHPL